MIDWRQNRDYLTWAENRLGQKFDERAATWLTSVSQTGSILGVVIFSRFTTGNCEISIVGDGSRFLTKKLILACVYYVFVQLDKRRVTAFIAVGNEKSLSLAQRLGFRVEGVARNWYPDGDANILGLIREDCKWLKEFHGLSQPSGSP